jgi:hypothetical protein
LEYFRGQYDWYDSVDASSGQAQHNKQGVNFINTGVTLVW